MKKLFAILALIAAFATGAIAQPVPEILIDPLITRDAEINPSGTSNEVCISGTPGPTFTVALCSTLALTGKTVHYKIPEFAFGSIPAGNPLVVVTNSSSSSVCDGGGAVKVICWHNGTEYVTIGSGGGGGGLPDPGASGIVARTALNTVIARTLATASVNRVIISNPDGVAGAPTFDTGPDIPTESGTNTFTGPNTFNDDLVIPRKATPGDLGTLQNGEIFIDGEIYKFKSNTGVVYTLLRAGDVGQITVANDPPSENEDSADGFSVGDFYIATQGTGTTTDDQVFVALDVTAGSAAWFQLGTSGSVPSRQQVFDSGKTITNADSASNAESTGNGTVQILRYVDSLNKAYQKCSPACDARQFIDTDKTGGWYDNEGQKDGEVIDPDAGSPYDKYQYHNDHRVLSSAQVPLRPSGDCTLNSSEAIVTNDPPAEWITCVDTTGDFVAFDFFVPGKMRTITALTVTMIAVNKHATPTGTFTLACAAQFVTPGVDVYAAHNTTGQQNVSFTTFDTQYRPEEASATITVNGTAAKNSHVKGQCNVSAVPGQIADIRLAGAAVIEGLAKSRSD